LTPEFKSVVTEDRNKKARGSSEPELQKKNHVPQKGIARCLKGRRRNLPKEGRVGGVRVIKD